MLEISVQEKILGIKLVCKKMKSHMAEFRSVFNNGTINFVQKQSYCTCSGGVVVRALTSHQCGLGSIPRLGLMCGLSLLVLYSALRGFPPGTPVFPFPQKPTFEI